MIQRFLKAKHWQIFIAFFGVPFLLYIFFFLGIIASAAYENESGIELLFFLGFPVIMLFTLGTLFGWFWSVGMGLQSKLPEGITMKTSSFKLFFFTPLIYIVLILGFMSTSVFQGGMISPVFLFLIVPLHLFSMFCMFYNIYFVAKTLKIIEKQRRVKTDEYIGEFFLIWFFFIGVWILQPKINQIIANDSPEPHNLT